MERKIDPVRFRHFVKHIRSAQEKLAEARDAKERLHQQIKKVKKYSISKRIKPTTLDKEIMLLDEHIREAINKEKRLLHGQASIKAELHQKVNELEKVIFSLQNELNKLEIQLAQTKASSQDTDKLKEMISELRQKIEKEEELEQEISKNVSKNLQEILKIEEEIKSLEEKFVEIKEKGAHPGLLSRISNRLFRLKGKARELKEKEIKKTEKEIPLPPSGMNDEDLLRQIEKEAEEQGLPPAEEEAPLQPPFPAPRHEMKLEFDKNKPLEFMPEELPATETADEVNLMPEPPLPEPPAPERKKSLFKKLF